jgi:hypothetical protein
MRLDAGELLRVRAEGPRRRLHHFEEGSGARVATLEVPRRGSAIFRFGEDAFFLERGKGWIRSYFQMWDAEREWLGASYRWSPWRRRIVVHVANGTYNLIPRAAFGRGFRLVDARGDVVLELRPERAFASTWILAPLRRIEPAVVALVYFLARRHALESCLPCGSAHPARRI